ncbi:MAG TPA: helix-turn-helix domain-containing protein [Polyangiaceae bacterium]
MLFSKQIASKFRRLPARTLLLVLGGVTATHRDLEAMVQQGTFREDLFYRLNVLPVWIAPLRARRVDIEDLANHFCAEVAKASVHGAVVLSAEALQTLTVQRWPGNVRQLQNFVERLVVLSGGHTVTAAHVKAELDRPVRFATETGPAGADAAEPAKVDESGVQGSAAGPLSRALHTAERQALLRALKQTAGNRSAAARLLAVSRTTLYSKLQEYGLL